MRDQQRYVRWTKAQRRRFGQLLVVVLAVDLMAAHYMDVHYIDKGLAVFPEKYPPATDAPSRNQHDNVAPETK
jgi:hypothetical protein